MKKATMKSGKILAIVLVIAMVLSISAFAAWPEYQGGSTHNGVVDAAPTSSSASVSQVPLGAAGWSGVDTEPLMRTVDGVTYAYVLYNGGNAGGKLSKINCSASTPYIVWTKQVSGANGFQLSTPLLVEGTTEAGDIIYLASGAADKYNDVALSAPVSVTAGSPANVSFSNLNLTTNSNRVAVGIYVGRTDVAGRGSITTSGSATIIFGNKTANLTLSTTTSSTRIYKIFEEEVYDGGVLVGYDYYYYINHNMAAGSGSGKSLSITVSLNGSGVIKYVDVYAQKAAVQSVTGLNTSNPVNTTIIGDIDGQINTPIAKSGNYLYFGIYNGSEDDAHAYYQVDVSIGTAERYSAGHDFYWAGALIDGGYVYFGSDDGYLYKRPVGANFATDTAAPVNLSQYVADAGNVRSDIMKYGNDLYFTSQGGYLWKYTPGTGTLIYQYIGASSTSTPTISANGWLYIGDYSYGVKGLLLSTFTANNAGSWANVANVGKVQSSIVVYSTTFYDDEQSDYIPIDYVYFTTNISGGCGYCFSFVPSTNAAAFVWDTGSGNFTLQGMAACNGYLTFGNDGNVFHVIHN